MTLTGSTTLALSILAYPCTFVLVVASMFAVASAAVTTVRLETPTIPRFDQLPVPSAPETSCLSRECSQLGSCLNCTFPNECDYGDAVNVTCDTNEACQGGQRSLRREAECRFCYQTDASEQLCRAVRNCSVTEPPPRHLVRTVCWVREHVLCRGRRAFYKRVRCHWTNGHRWSTALLLSVTLGGFGADRFYLGLWKSAIGKLFSFGGLGVWTLVDVILIATGYVGPADGSLYLT